MFTTGKWLVLSFDVVLRNVFTEKREISLTKYNEDNVNYANSKRRDFKVGIM